MRKMREMRTYHTLQALSQFPIRGRVLAAGKDLEVARSTVRHGDGVGKE